MTTAENRKEQFYDFNHNAVILLSYVSNRNIFVIIKVMTISCTSNSNIISGVNTEDLSNANPDSISSKCEIVSNSFYDGLCGKENEIATVAWSISEFLQSPELAEYKHLQSLIEKISIAANTEKELEGISKDANSLEQIKRLLFILETLYELPSGEILLNHLCKLLTEHEDKLFFSFSLLEGDTPKTNAKIQQIPCAVENKYDKKWHGAFIDLPKAIPENMRLILYDPQKKEVIKIAEPFEIIIGHELIHCIQNLTHEAQLLDETKTISLSIQNEIKDRIDMSERSVNWYKAFWGGADRNTWPDELQAMLLGIEIDGKRISETALLQDFLRSEKLPNVFQAYRNKKLIPFGHTDPEDKVNPLVESDKERFEKLLFKLGEIENYKEKTTLENSSKAIKLLIIEENKKPYYRWSKESSCVVV